MTFSPDASPPFASTGHDQPVPRLSWFAVIGFGALGLLWPLLRLLQVDTFLGPLPTAAIGFTLTALVWVVCTGFGNVPRPVVTLVLAGVLSGVLFAADGFASGEWPDVGPLVIFVAFISEVVLAGILGALAGLAAWGIQLSRRTR